MKQVEKKYTVGVVVGRFQADQLHRGHKDLIEHSLNNHYHTIVVLGVSRLRNTRRNPLDVRARTQMILDEYPDVTICSIKDEKSDNIWSKKLDDLIHENTTVDQNAVLYGSRDSFASHYSGRFDVRVMEAEHKISATEVRDRAANDYKRDPSFRAGMIAATTNRFPISYQTVDIAILKGDQILLGRKANETEYRFIGGFADPSSDSLETDARREVLEETGLSVEKMTYIGSTKIDDWRYRGEVDCIKTVFFMTSYVFGRPQASDDIVEVKWFPLFNLDKKTLVECHEPLYDMLIKKLESSWGKE